MAEVEKEKEVVLEPEQVVVEPNYSWWVVFRDGKDGPFSSLTTNDKESALDQVYRLGHEKPNRQLWLLTMRMAFESVVRVDEKEF